MCYSHHCRLADGALALDRLRVLAAVGGGVNEAALRSSILRVLGRWGVLPESDLVRGLPPEQAVDFGLPLLQAMTAAGLITVTRVGDERVIRLTERGRAEAGASQPL